MKIEPCRRCNGKVMLDRAYCNYGHVELSCIKCGARWEFHKTHQFAVKINKLEKMRELGLNGVDPFTFLSQ
jgi:hypothetical protein